MTDTNYLYEYFLANSPDKAEEDPESGASCQASDDE